MKFTWFKEENNVIKLHFDNNVTITVDNKDAVEYLSQYKLTGLLGKEYQPIKSVTELVKIYKLEKRDSYVKVATYNLPL